MPHLRREGDADGLFRGDVVRGIEQFQHHRRALAGRAARLIVEVRMRGPILRDQRGILHHVERRSIAVLHVALRRISDLHQVFERVYALPLAGAGGTGHGARRIAAVGTHRDPAVAHVVNVSVHGSDHDVLRHVLQPAERLFGLRQIVRRGHFPRRVEQAEFVGIRNRGGVGLAVLVGHNRAVVGGFDAHVLILHLVPRLDGDALRADLEQAPLVFELVLAVPHFFFVDVGRVRASGGHGDGEEAAVPQRGERLAENGRAGEREVAAVDAHFVEADFAVPGEVWIDHGDGNVKRSARGRQRHFVGAVVNHRVGLHTAAQQIAAGLAFGPAPDDVASQRDDLPGLEFGRPGRYLFGMLLHEFLNAGLVGFANGAQVRRQFRIVLAGHVAMTPQALAVIVVDEFGAERFRHGAFGFAVIAQQFFEAVFSLHVAGGERSPRGGGGVDVRHAELVAQNLDLLRRAQSERYQQQHKGFHRSTV